MSDPLIHPPEEGWDRDGSWAAASGGRSLGAAAADPWITGEVPVTASTVVETDVPTSEVVLDPDPTPIGGVRVVRRRRWPKRTALGALALVLLAVGYYSISLFQVWSTGRHDQARPVDAIVVMGAAQYDGRPSPVLAARLDHAADLWDRGLADYVVVTGGKLNGDRFTEAEASARYLVDAGVPSAVIVQEDTGASSYESLVNVERQLRFIGLHSILLVSDPYHSLRIRLIAEELGIEAYTSPTRTSPVRGGAAFSKTLKEAAGVSVGRVVSFRRLFSWTG